jgi:hypothetical protein
MVARIRYLALALVVVVLLIGGVAYAYPWTLVSRYYAFQLTNPSISPTSFQGFSIVLPQCYISSNPYGIAGTYGLISCTAIKYGAVSVIVWFYLPPNGMGTLLAIEHYQYPLYISGSSGLLYVGTNGHLYAGDYSGSLLLVGTPTPISSGWHMAVFEEWASSTSGPYYLDLYLDGQYIGSVTFSSGTQLFGSIYGPYPYSYIGTQASGWPYTPSGSVWWFFNGTIAYVAVYNTVLSQSQVQQLYQAGFPNELFSQNLVVAYLLVNNTASIYQGPNYVDYVIPWFANNALLSQLNIINPSTFVITPSGSQGLVPETQFLGPIPNNLFSWCRLLQSVSVSVPGSVYVNQSFNVNVQLTTITQMQYELPYWFLVGINGTNESQVLRVDAWLFSSDAESAYTFINSTTLVAPPKPGNYTVVVSLPVCNMTWTEQITVDPPPSNASTTGSNGNNSTSPPPINSTQFGPGTSSTSSSSSTTSTGSTTSLSVLIDALNTVVQYLVNPVVVVVVVLIVAVAYILYMRRETVVRL